MKRTGLLTTIVLAVCLSTAACSKSGPSGVSQNTPQGGPQTPAAQTAQTEVDFAREVFTRLSAGDAAVESAIDWDNLVTLGDDFGKEYRKETDAGRAAARKGFIEGFSSSFREEGGAAEKIVNWREESREGEKTLVAADLPTGATLLLTVTTTSGGQKKLSALAAEQPES